MKNLSKNISVRCKEAKCIFLFLFLIFLMRSLFTFDLVVFAAYGLVSGRGRNSSVGRESDCTMLTRV